MSATQDEGQTALELREERFTYADDPSDCAHSAVEVINTTQSRHLGENLGYSTYDGDHFHADKHCPHINGVRVIAQPISYHWAAVPWLHKPCSYCTIDRGPHEDIVPYFELSREAACEIDGGDAR